MRQLALFLALICQLGLFTVSVCISGEISHDFFEALSAAERVPEGSSLSTVATVVMRREPQPRFSAARQLLVAFHDAVMANTEARLPF